MDNVDNLKTRAKNFLLCGQCGQCGQLKNKLSTLSTNCSGKKAENKKCGQCGQCGQSVLSPPPSLQGLFYSPIYNINILNLKTNCPHYPQTAQSRVFIGRKRGQSRFLTLSTLLPTNRRKRKCCKASSAWTIQFVQIVHKQQKSAYFVNKCFTQLKKYVLITHAHNLWTILRG